MRKILSRLAVIWLWLFTLASLSGTAQVDIFLTPIPNVPFSGTVNMERSRLQPDGSILKLHTSRGIGRDREGRTYHEHRSLVPTSNTTLPPPFSVELYDPQTRVVTFLDPHRHTYMARTVGRPPATEPPNFIASPMGTGLPPSPFTRQEDLGTRLISGVSAHGVRQTQTVPLDISGTSKELVITDEFWYSDELHINLAIQHDDPRTGTDSIVVSQIELSDPDPALFQIPDGYSDMDAAHGKHPLPQ